MYWWAPGPRLTEGPGENRSSYSFKDGLPHSLVFGSSTWLAIGSWGCGSRLPQRSRVKKGALLRTTSQRVTWGGRGLIDRDHQGRLWIIKFTKVVVAKAGFRIAWVGDQGRGRRTPPTSSRIWSMSLSTSSRRWRSSRSSDVSRRWPPYSSWRPWTRSLGERPLSHVSDLSLGEGPLWVHWFGHQADQRAHRGQPEVLRQCPLGDRGHPQGGMPRGPCRPSDTAGQHEHNWGLVMVVITDAARSSSRSLVGSTPTEMP